MLTSCLGQLPPLQVKSWALLRHLSVLLHHAPAGTPLCKAHEHSRYRKAPMVWAPDWKIGAQLAVIHMIVSSSLPCLLCTAAAAHAACLSSADAIDAPAQAAVLLDCPGQVLLQVLGPLPFSCPLRYTCRQRRQGAMCRRAFKNPAWAQHDCKQESEPSHSTSCVAFPATACESLCGDE